jgi:predicted PurR-regulated permease PerM
MTPLRPAARDVIRLTSLVVLTIIVVLFAVWLLVALRSVALLLGLALLLGVALLPAVNGLMRLTKQRASAVMLVALALLALFALFGFLVAPPMVEQGRALYDDAPALQQRLAREADARDQTALGDRIREFETSDAVSTDLLVRTGLGALSFVIAFFTLFFLVIYFLIDVERLSQFLFFSTPRGWHPHLHALLPALRTVVGGYIRGQAITSASIAVFSYVMLTVLRVPNALALAGIAAVADLIPLVGVFILMTPMVLVAFGVSPLTAALVLGLMLAYQQFEDRFLVPKVYGSTLRLPTIAVVVAILIGAQLMGIIGALVALPIAAAARVIIEYFATVKHESPAAAGAEVVSP